MQLVGFKNVTIIWFLKKNVVKIMAFSYFHCNCTIWCRGKWVFALKVRRHKTKRKQSNKQHRRNQMKFNKWTVGLAAIGVISLASAARADEAKMAMWMYPPSGIQASKMDTMALWGIPLDMLMAGLTKLTALI
jgi:hypothetical protein